MAIDYIGWEPYLDPHRDDPYGDESDADEAGDVEELADDDDEGMDDCETVAEYRKIKQQWADYLDEQAAQHDA